MYLTKSDFIYDYLVCPIHLWVQKHCKPVRGSDRIVVQRAWMAEQGHDVEKLARRLFPAGQLVHGHDTESAERTRALIQDGATTLFQATVHADRLLAMADMLQFDDQLNYWNIYEVKSSTRAKKEHYHDLCFQRRAFESAGFRVGRLFLVLVNRNYVHAERVDPHEFLRIEDATDNVVRIKGEIDGKIDNAIRVLDHDEQPTRLTFGCSCRPKDCDCLEHCFPAGVPTDSVFGIARLRPKKALALHENSIARIAELPDTYPLTKAQAFQVSVVKSGKPHIDRIAIHGKLSSLRYPLYFLDYESIALAIPCVDGCRPYQQMVFQYSLHVLPTPNSDLEHREYIADSPRNVTSLLTTNLRRDIRDSGTIIVWNQSFEVSRNKEMAKNCPEMARFLNGVNSRVFDLMTIFRDQHYVDPNFRGSNSIKDVLPVLVPDLTYASLEIQSGIGASLAWFRMITTATSNVQQAKMRASLLAYCKLDTMAMVKIFKCLELCCDLRS